MTMLELDGPWQHADLQAALDGAVDEISLGRQGPLVLPPDGATYPKRLVIDGLTVQAGDIRGGVVFDLRGVRWLGGHVVIDTAGAPQDDQHGAAFFLRRGATLFDQPEVTLLAPGRMIACFWLFEGRATIRRPLVRLHGPRVAIAAAGSSGRSLAWVESGSELWLEDADALVVEPRTQDDALAVHGSAHVTGGRFRNFADLFGVVDVDEAAVIEADAPTLIDCQTVVFDKPSLYTAGAHATRNVTVRRPVIIGTIRFDPDDPLAGGFASLAQCWAGGHPDTVLARSLGTRIEAAVVTAPAMRSAVDLRLGALAEVSGLWVDAVCQLSEGPLVGIAVNLNQGGSVSAGCCVEFLRGCAPRAGR